MTSTFYSKNCNTKLLNAIIEVTKKSNVSAEIFYVRNQMLVSA